LPHQRLAPSPRTTTSPRTTKVSSTRASTASAQAKRLGARRYPGACGSKPTDVPDLLRSLHRSSVSWRALTHRTAGDAAARPRCGHRAVPDRRPPAAGPAAVEVHL
jgi:hypothetical protein